MSGRHRARHRRRTPVVAQGVRVFSVVSITGMLAYGIQSYIHPSEEVVAVDVSPSPTGAVHPDRLPVPPPLPFVQVIDAAAAVATTTPPPPVVTTKQAPPVKQAPTQQRNLTASCPTSGWGLKSNAAQVAYHIQKMFGVETIGGYRAVARDPSGHPSGLAVDFTVSEAVGDRIAQYLLDHMSELGVEYVIWEQRLNYGSGWQPMKDRGSVTENHYDHVHVNIISGAAVPGATC